MGRAYVRRDLYLGDGAWEELFDALVRRPCSWCRRTRRWRRQEAVHNDLLRIVVVTGAGHCVRRDQPARYFQALDVFLAEVARA